ncbi:MAG: PAS domain S-box protein [Candidatus Poribacteria bacterium]|nr:PAS domain S-box protein [Candidatus Poribacteria bacterium]
MADAKILVVEDEPTVAEFTEILLETLGYTVSAVVPSGEEAIQKAAETNPDLALIDMMLDGNMDGIAVAEQMRDRFDIPVVYLTGHADEELLQRAKITAPFGYILKPFEERRLHLNIEIALYRHEMEKKFKESEQWLSTILKSIGDAVIATDKNGCVTFVNPVAEALTGWRQEEVFGKDLAEVLNVIRDGTRIPIKNHIMKALQQEIVAGQTEHIILIARDGREIPIDYNATPIRDGKENITGVVLAFRNITKRKQVEQRLTHTAEALRNQARILQSILDSIGDGVIVAQKNGEFLLFNPDAERIIGIGPTDVPPDEWVEAYGMFLPDTVTPFPTDEHPLIRAIHGKASDDVEMFIRNPQVPEGVYISVTGRPLQDESGVLWGGVVVFRDITDRQRAEEALAQAYTQGRLEVVDAILHNIGNAINSVTIGIGTIYENLVSNKLTRRLVALANAIKGHQDDFSSYVKNDPEGPKVAPFIQALAQDFIKQDEKLAKTVNRVQDRAEHIADIVRMQKSLGRRSVYRKDIALRKTIDDTITVLGDSIRGRDIQIHIDCGNAPKTIRTQESQFHQMLVNLVKNSIEAIDELSVCVGLNQVPSIKIRCYVELDSLILEVTDNGIGIEADKFGVIFGGDYTTKKSGSGLGLHSIATFVQSWGGEIAPISGGIGKGVTMRVRLPLSSVTP